VPAVTLRLNGRDLAMTPETGGWWSAPPRPRDGDRYGFIVNGEGPFPDPRSRSQPDGVDGLSQWVDHDAFAWTDAAWQAPPIASAVFYELHVGTFTPEGTFESAIARLDDLVRLGITHIEVLPIAEFPGARGWGYDGVDLYAPHHAYGGTDGLKRFVDACHARQLAIVLDVVYNHLGPSGNYLARFGPYFHHRYHTPWGAAINLDGPDSGEVRRFFSDNALMWLRDYHVDGLRLDAVHAFIDLSAVHFLEQLRHDVDRLEARLGRHLALVAESDLNDPRLVQSRERGGFGFDAQWNDDFHHALHAVLTGERSGYYEDFGTLEDLADAIRNVFVYAGRFSRHRRRQHGRPVDGIPGSRFIVAAQNHDQVGNRARGERLTHLVPLPRLYIAAAVVLTSPFVPLIFQGEEWGASTPFLYFTSHEDAALAQAVSAGRRNEFRAFGWTPDEVPDPQAVETFEASKLRWDEREGPAHAALLNWISRLIELRRGSALSDGGYAEAHVAFDEDQRWMSIVRGSSVTAFNLDEQPRRLRLPVETLLLASSDQIRIDDDGLVLPPDSVAVARLLGSPPASSPGTDPHRSAHVAAAHVAGDNAPEQPESTGGC
jgi:maltooligosyltrehalose trehalohydrolase